MAKLQSTAIFALSIALLTLSSPGQVDPPENDSASPVVISPQPPKTRLEAAGTQKGVLVIEGRSDIGVTVPGDDGSAVAITAAEFTNASTQAKEYGLIITVHQAHAVERDAKSYVDYDEIDGLISALTSMQKLDHTVTQLADFSAHFRTKGDLQISNVNWGNGRELAVRSVQIGTASGEVTWATAHHPLARLSDLIQYLENGKQAIDKLKLNK